MQTLETMKIRSQERFTNLVEKAKEQPDDLKAWGVAAGGALVGAVAVTAAASGIVAILTAFATPPVALTVGAVGGGLLGWKYMQERQAVSPAVPTPVMAPPVMASEPAAVEPPLVTETIDVSDVVVVALPPDAPVMAVDAPIVDAPIPGVADER
ncbi:MAG: hypothetical protein KF832_21675 [Caldilineaceae bacterium]|nr:hypothetical protein [Caldilineaceae bacterium]